MIIFETNRTIADAVLAILKGRIDSERDSEWRLGFYNNGRENGYVLSLEYVNGSLVLDDKLSCWIAFSEFRNSDNTVVYTDYGYWNNKLTEKSYDKKHFFRYGDFIGATDYIIKIMNEAVEKVKQSRKEKELEGVQ